jgi:predicted nucleic acid-binding protein
MTDWNSYRKVAMDTNCFIYYLEDSPFATSLGQLFTEIESGSITAVTSALTVTELMTGLYQQQDRRAAEEYRMTLANFPHLQFRSVDFSIADKAAELRSRFRLKTPDAIQLATAIVDKADVFVTGDKHFQDIDFPVIMLS